MPLKKMKKPLPNDWQTVQKLHTQHVRTVFTRHTYTYCPSF